jgi:hypothetical protein
MYCEVKKQSYLHIADSTYNLGTDQKEVILCKRAITVLVTQ